MCSNLFSKPKVSTPVVEQVAPAPQNVSSSESKAVGDQLKEQNKKRPPELSGGLCFILSFPDVLFHDIADLAINNLETGQSVARGDPHAVILILNHRVNHIIQQSITCREQLG